MRVLGHEVLGQVLRLPEMWRQRGGGQGRVEQGERLGQGLVFEGGVQVLGSLFCCLFVRICVCDGAGKGGGKGGRTVCQVVGLGASAGMGLVVGGGWMFEGIVGGVVLGCCRGGFAKAVGDAVGRGLWGCRRRRVCGWWVGRALVGAGGRRLLLCRWIGRLGLRMPFLEYCGVESVEWIVG